jgi:hypothetical protein
MVGQGVKGALEDVYADAEAAVDRSLEGWTLSDLLDRTRVRGKSSSSKTQV